MIAHHSWHCSILGWLAEGIGWVKVDLLHLCVKIGHWIWRHLGLEWILTKRGRRLRSCHRNIGGRSPVSRSHCEGVLVLDGHCHPKRVRLSHRRLLPEAARAKSRLLEFLSLGEQREILTGCPKGDCCY